MLALLRRSYRAERGSVTVEAAVGIATLVLVFGLIVAGLVTLAQYLSAVDTAGAAARAHAIGAEYPEHSSSGRVRVEVVESAGLATATARISTVIGELSAQAIYPVEYQ